VRNNSKRKGKSIKTLGMSGFTFPLSNFLGPRKTPAGGKAQRKIVRRSCQKKNKKRARKRNRGRMSQRHWWRKRGGNHIDVTPRARRKRKSEAGKG